MKLTTVIGTAIAALSLAACGSTVPPTVTPTLAPPVSPTVSPTIAPTDASTLAPTVAPTPTITYCTNGGSLGVGFPCPGVTFKTACVAGDPGVGSVTFTFTQGKTTPGDVPDSITFDGNVVDVHGANPFFFGPTNAGTYPVIVDGYA